MDLDFYVTQRKLPESDANSEKIGLKEKINDVLAN
jgi:hypothetical protein